MMGSPIHSWCLVQKRARVETRSDEIDEEDDDYEALIERGRVAHQAAYGVGEGPLPVIDPPQQEAVGEGREIGEEDDDYDALIERGRAAHRAAYGVGEGPLPVIDLPKREVCRPGADSTAHSDARPHASASAQSRVNSSASTDARGSACSSASDAGIRGTVQKALAAKKARTLEERRKAQGDKAAADPGYDPTKADQRHAERIIEELGLQESEPTDLASMMQHLDRSPVFYTIGAGVTAAEKRAQTLGDLRAIAWRTSSLEKKKPGGALQDQRCSESSLRGAQEEDRGLSENANPSGREARPSSEGREQGEQQGRPRAPSGTAEGPPLESTAAMRPRLPLEVEASRPHPPLGSSGPSSRDPTGRPCKARKEPQAPHLYRAEAEKGKEEVDQDGRKAREQFWVTPEGPDEVLGSCPGNRFVSWQVTLAAMEPSWFDLCRGRDRTQRADQPMRSRAAMRSSLTSHRVQASGALALLLFSLILWRIAWRGSDLTAKRAFAWPGGAHRIPKGWRSPAAMLRRLIAGEGGPKSRWMCELCDRSSITTASQLESPEAGPKLADRCAAQCMLNEDADFGITWCNAICVRPQAHAEPHAFACSYMNCPGEQCRYCVPDAWDQPLRFAAHPSTPREEEGQLALMQWCASQTQPADQCSRPPRITDVSFDCVEGMGQPGARS